MRLDQSGVAEHAVDAGGTDRDDIGVEHHEGQPTVAFQGMPGVEVEDGLLLPVLQPPIAGDQRVVLVGQAVACTPVVELARGDSQPRDEPLDGNLGASGPVAGRNRRSASRTSWGTQALVRVPQALFLAGYVPPSIPRRPRSCAGACRAARRWSADVTALATHCCRSKAAAPFSKNSFCQA